MKTGLMARCALSLATLATALALATGLARADDDHDDPRVFATLPDGLRFPEGITANPRTREIIVGTFDTEPGRPNALLRFARNGRLIAQRSFGISPLLGLAFHAPTNKIYIANFGASKIQRIPADFDSATPIEDVGDIPIASGPPLPRTVPNPDGSSDTITFGTNFFPAPNGLVFDKSGRRLFVSDSFLGAIFGWPMSARVLRSVYVPDRARSIACHRGLSSFRCEWDRAEQGRNGAFHREHG